MKFPQWLPVFGDQSFRGQCPHEDYALASFFDRLRKDYPTTYGLVAFHPKNEGQRTTAQIKVDKRKGFKKGVCDVIIAGNPAFCLEIKRDDHTQSRWADKEQLEFLEQAQKQGAFVCVALGYKASLEAFGKWREMVENKQ